VLSVKSSGWQRVVASQTATRYNPFTKAREYNHYDRSQRSRMIERGTYAGANGVLQFQPKDKRERTGPRNSDPPLFPKAAPASYARPVSGVPKAVLMTPSWDAEIGDCVACP